MSSFIMYCERYEYETRFWGKLKIISHSITKKLSSCIDIRVILALQYSVLRNAYFPICSSLKKYMRCPERVESSYEKVVILMKK